VAERIHGRWTWGALRAWLIGISVGTGGWVLQGDEFRSLVNERAERYMGGTLAYHTEKSVKVNRGLIRAIRQRIDIKEGDVLVRHAEMELGYYISR
jgi:hypothetical protein